MALNNPYMQYKESSVFTAAPEDLTLMLYNGIIKFIMQGQQAIKEKNIEKSNLCILKAQNIVIELRTTLNLKYEIAKQLEALYGFMYSRLVDANIKKDSDILVEVLDLAKELRDTWAQAMKLAKKAK